MYDKELVVSILEQIYEATQKVEERFSTIKSVEDFTNSAEGMIKLDAICMQLIAIGESIKNVDKITNMQLLNLYSEVDWKGAKGMRDIISHHYFDIDAEQIFWVCEKNIPQLSKTLLKIISDNQEQT